MVRIQIREELDIVKCFMERVNEVIPQEELLKIAPHFGNDILNMLTRFLIVSITDGGYIFKDSEAKEMNIVLKVIKKNIPSNSTPEELDYLLTTLKSLGYEE